MMSTLIIAKVQDAIYDWIRQVMNGVIPPEQIIWRDQSQMVPARPCVTMKITDGPKPVGRQGSVFQGTNGSYNVGVQATMTVSIQIFGNAKVNSYPIAQQRAADLHASLMDENVTGTLRIAGISIQDRGDVLNISALEETEFEDRAQFDVTIGVAQNIVSNPGFIQTVNGQGVVSEIDVPFHETT